MIMKRIIYILIIGVFLLPSCGDEFLETVPYSFTSPDNFYQTEADFELAINGVYDIINGTGVQGQGNLPTWGRGMYFMLNGSTDEAVANGATGGVTYAPHGNASYTSDSYFLRYNWFYWYVGINRANFVLENIDNIEFKNTARQAEIKGEAYFLRGLYHYYLANLFGGVPVYTTSVQDPEASRQPLSEVYPQVILDLTYAYENLPDVASIKGRANKWTAAGFLAKTYCYLGSAKKNNVGASLAFSLNSFDWVDGADMYSKALTVSNDIIANSGYKLTENYDYLFRETTRSAQYEETLLAAEACDDAGNYKINVILNNLCPQGNRNTVGGGYGWQRPLGELYTKYDANDGRRDHNLTANFSGPITQEVIEGVNYYAPRPLPGPTTGWYCCGKFRMRDPKEKPLVAWASDINFPLLRYADILLLNAEARYETGDEPGARNMLTTVRERVSTDVNVLNTAYYNVDFIQELLDERSRELCFEGVRRFDLVRFGVYTDVISGLSTATTVGFYNKFVPTLQANWEEFKIWFPIPISETEVNLNLVQNPGWIAE
jgi:starch-binding outer membrane protein, SusD/RagB family